MAEAVAEIETAAEDILEDVTEDDTTEPDKGLLVAELDVGHEADVTLVEFELDEKPGADKVTGVLEKAGSMLEATLEDGTSEVEALEPEEGSREYGPAELDGDGCAGDDEPDEGTTVQRPQSEVFIEDGEVEVRVASVKEVKVTKVEGGPEVIGETVSIEETIVVKDREVDDELKE